MSPMAWHNGCATNIMATTKYCDQLHQPAPVMSTPWDAAPRRLGVDMPAEMRTLIACSTAGSRWCKRISLSIRSRSAATDACASSNRPVKPRCNRSASAILLASHNRSASLAAKNNAVRPKNTPATGGGTTTNRVLGGLPCIWKQYADVTPHNNTPTLFTMRSAGEVAWSMSEVNAKNETKASNGKFITGEAWNRFVNASAAKTKHAAKFAVNEARRAGILGMGGVAVKIGLSCS
mmetsp:Transcript_88782/g.256051  ORF Transcript_88782/g.256051 Transcript_88782/m.256051 type:complete len:235 (+) Transcript_88782:572-1276(+)